MSPFIVKNLSLRTEKEAPPPHTHVILPHDPAPPTWVSSLFSMEGELAGVFHSYGVIHLHKVPKAQR